MSQPRVLLAEDGGPTRRLLAFTLDWGGFDVHQASGGDDALAQLADAQPDVLVADMTMSGLDGIGLIHAVRSQPGFADLPVLMLTDSDDEEHRFQELHLPLTGMLRKPPQWREVLPALDRLLPTDTTHELRHPAPD